MIVLDHDQAHHIEIHGGMVIGGWKFFVDLVDAEGATLALILCDSYDRAIIVADQIADGLTVLDRVVPMEDA